MEASINYVTHLLTSHAPPLRSKTQRYAGPHLLPLVRNVIYGQPLTALRLKIEIEVLKSNNRSLNKLISWVVVGSGGKRT